MDLNDNHNESIYSLSHSHQNDEQLSIDNHRYEKNLKLAFILTACILATEFFGAILSKSMALYADSGHIFVDASSLFLVWIAQIQVKKEPTQKNTYGFHRLGILAALINSGLLLVISIVLIYESYLRLVRPEIVNSKLMVLFAGVSFIVNIIIGIKIHKDIHKNLNIKSSFFHVIGDGIISFSIIIAGIAIYFTKIYYVDAVIGLMVAPVIAIGAFSVINETINILLEGVPKEVDYTKVQEEMLKISGVQNVHDLHIWSLSKSFILLTAHILVNDETINCSDLCCIINNIQYMLAKKFGINHSVIQPELVMCDKPDSYCIARRK
jgi:cobalt-zinc-cadmium efflux system protein